MIMKEENTISVNTKDIIVLLWSGGLDSTYLLQELVYELENRNEYFRFNKVLVLSLTPYVKFGGMANQLKYEKKARDKIKKILSKDHKQAYKQLQFIELTIPGTFFNLNDIHSKIIYLGQAQTNIINTIMVFPNQNLQLVLGYHKGDDFWVKYPEIYEAARSVAKINNTSLDIRFPIAFMYKDDIYLLLDDKLKPLIHYCENPNENGSPCNDCSSCRTFNKFIKE